MYQTSLFKRPLFFWGFISLITTLFSAVATLANCSQFASVLSDTTMAPLSALGSLLGFVLLGVVLFVACPCGFASGVSSVREPSDLAPAQSK